MRYAQTVLLSTLLCANVAWSQDAGSATGLDTGNGASGTGPVFVAETGTPDAGLASNPAAFQEAAQASSAMTGQDDAAETVEDIATPRAELGVFEKIDKTFGEIFVAPLGSLLFYDLWFWDNDEAGQVAIPFIVFWLVLGALYFTFRMGFVNIRAFVHAIDVVRGKYDEEDHEGEISHFQALSSALSATVGLGNIAGVAVAVGTGGPGAVFWMVVAGFLGMSSKFVECSLGQMYRTIDSQGAVSGGPMRYLETGLRDMGLSGLGRVLAILFAVMCIGGSFGGGNMFQANQAFAAVRGVVQDFAGADISSYNWLFGLILAALVGLVIIGGIKRIGAAASFIVPLMCGVYLLAGVAVLFAHIEQVPAALGHIISSAFTPEAGYGGLIGVLIVGFQRAAFSNEAGVGSASIAHSAASTDEPIREGIVALLEPFIDTILVCTMTGLVVVVTGAYKSDVGDGVLMTSAAFASVIPWFPIVLSGAVLLFAFSTMISWSYYGERCFTLLFGQSARATLVYRFIFLIFVFFGSVFKLGNVLDFSDFMVLGMAFPNIAGLLLLSGKVRAALDDYWHRFGGASAERGK